MTLSLVTCKQKKKKKKKKTEKKTKKKEFSEQFFPCFIIAFLQVRPCLLSITRRHLVLVHTTVINIVRLIISVSCILDHRCDYLFICNEWISCEKFLYEIRFSLRVHLIAFLYKIVLPDKT